MPQDINADIQDKDKDKKKRGRKKKDDEVKEEEVTSAGNGIQYTIEDVQLSPEETPSSKKRGRKPRGGKLVARQQEASLETNSISNVILHLKCSLNDLNEYHARISKLLTDPLEYKPEIPTEILSYNDNTAGFTQFNEPNLSAASTHTSAPAPSSITGASKEQTSPNACSLCSMCRANVKYGDYELKNVVFEDPEVENVNLKEINQKLKQLKVMLYKNAIQMDKKSACFWCTCEYDNTPCYIPKYEVDGVIYGYGSFCRPECGVAYLMRENIDDSTKFERYNMMNQIYGKVYNCKKNIKPAPDPYYTLDKFYGNMSIQEYRKLLKTEHLLLVLDKPFTRILPELHEDNDELIMNIYGINKHNTQVSGVYKVKKQSEKQQGPSKTSIIRDKFFSVD